MPTKLSYSHHPGLNYGLAVGSTKVELDLTGDDVTKIERDLLSFHPYIGWGRTLFKQRGIVGIHLKSSHNNDNSGLVLGLGFEAPSLQFGLDGSNEEVKVHLNYINVEY